MSKTEIARALSNSPRAQQQRQEIQTVAELQDQVGSISQSMADLTDETRQAMIEVVERQNQEADRMAVAADRMEAAALRAEKAAQNATKAASRAQKVHLWQAQKTPMTIFLAVMVSVLASSLVASGLWLLATQ